MWAAATSGTIYASQHHIQDKVHLSKVTLQFVDPFLRRALLLLVLELLSAWSVLAFGSASLL